MTSPLSSSGLTPRTLADLKPYLNCIDALLRVPQMLEFPVETNALLDLRRHLLDPLVTPEELTDAFCRSRQSAGDAFCLPFHRLGQLLELELELVVSDRQGRISDERFPLPMSWRNVDGMKRSCQQARFEQTADPVSFNDLRVDIVPRERSL